MKTNTTFTYILISSAVSLTFVSAQLLPPPDIPGLLFEDQPAEETTRPDPTPAPPDKPDLKDPPEIGTPPPDKPKPRGELADAEDVPAATVSLPTKPVSIDGKKHLPLRVVSRPFSHLYKEPNVAKGIVYENLPPFSGLVVYQRPKTAGVDGADESGWYLVGADTNGKILGWMRAKDVMEWKQALCVEYVHPDAAHPVLMFRDKDSLAAITSDASEARHKETEALYQAIESGSIPQKFPVISMSPKRMVDFQQQFYLMPILDHEKIQLEAWEGRLLKVAAATKAEAGRGATLIADDEDRKALLQSSTGSEAVMEELKIDIVFVMDLTRSMQPFVDGALSFVREASRELGSNPQLKDRVRFGFWGYRDSEEIDGIGFLTKNYADPLQPLDGFGAALEKIQVTTVDSVDYEEDVYGGVYRALSETAWTPGSSRFLILVGDAPSHEKGHDWNSSKMGAEELQALADKNKVSIFGFQIKDPKFSKYHGKAESQFKQLGANPGVAAETPSYYSTNTRDMKAFSEDAKKMVAGFAAPILKRVDLTTPIDSASATKSVNGAKDDLGESVEATMRAAVVRWLGDAENVEAPKDIVAWVADKDLLQPSSQALRVNVLLNKNQLDTLVKTLETTLVAAARGGKSGQEFFKELQATAAAAAVSPEHIEHAGKLAGSGLVPEFLSDLPYESEVMSLTVDKWDSWPETRQAGFLKTLEAKIAFYRELHDSSDGWISLAKQSDDSEKVKPIPLNRLP